MSTTASSDPVFAHVEALLDLFDPPRPPTCDVPGCTHWHSAHHEATWVGDAVAA